MKLCRNGLHVWVVGQKQCPHCHAAAKRMRRVRGLESSSSKKWKSKETRLYGLSVTRYEEMKAGGRCEVCGDHVQRRCVDHSHRSGKVRGSVCRHCNLMLGFARDDPARLSRGAAYLIRRAA